MSYWSAQIQDDIKKYEEAIHLELCSLELNEIWTYILEGSRARNAKIIGCK
jgi:hypothetical protein